MILSVLYYKLVQALFLKKNCITPTGFGTSMCLYSVENCGKYPSKAKWKYYSVRLVLLLTMLVNINKKQCFRNNDLVGQVN